MKANKVNKRFDARGVSIIEVLVALSIFTIAILVLASTGLVSTRTLRAGRSYMTASAVAQTKLDSLTSLGWTGLTGVSGSATVQGYPVTWEVYGVNPKRIILVVHRQVAAKVYADSFVTYVAQ